MKLSLLLFAVLVPGISCEKKAKPPKTYGGEIAVVYGDCGASKSVFESGPRPVPGDDVINDEAALAALETSEAKAIAAAEQAKAKELDRRKAEAEAAAEAVAKAAGAAMVADAGALKSLPISGEQGQLSALISSSDKLDSRLGSALSNLRGADGEMRGGFGMASKGTGLAGLGSGSLRGSTSGAGGGSKGWGPPIGGPSPKLSSRDIPTVRIGTTQQRGDLDKNIIRRVLRRDLGKIKQCYQRGLDKDPQLKGRVVVDWTISAEGSVSHASANGMPGLVDDCISRTIRKIVFPKPRGGGIVRVKYPFVFGPANGATADDIEAPVSVAEKPNAVEASVADDKRVGSYVAGKSNPLAQVSGDIEQCIRETTSAESTPHGGLLVGFAVDTSGKVRRAVAQGSGDSRFLECVANAAKKMQLKSGERNLRAYRCPLAYGDGRVESVPGVDIGKGAIRANGHHVAATNDIYQDPSPQWKIEALAKWSREVSERRREKAMRDGIAITGPLLVRPLPTTRAKVLRRVLKTLSAAGRDPILAAVKGDSWYLLRDISIPVAPVRLGTGRPWQREQQRQGWSDALQPNVPPRISVLITDRDIWVGATGSEDRFQVRKDGQVHDFGAVAKALGELRNRPQMAKVTVVEVGAEDSVLYSDIVASIDAVLAGRFPDWKLIEPAALSVKFVE